jgi:lipocalin
MVRLTLLTFVLAISHLTQAQTMNTIQNVDVNRYLGTWYEVARFNHIFERGLVGVTATYSLKKNGNLRVENKGYDKTLEGKLKKATGFAKVKGPGKLKVYFFWPFGGDYWILDLDTANYQYALVGTPDRNYLWILSRTPQMDAAVYQSLIDKAKSLGFDTSKLLTVDQPKAN